MLFLKEAIASPSQQEIFPYIESTTIWWRWLASCSKPNIKGHAAHSERCPVRVHTLRGKELSLSGCTWVRLPRLQEGKPEGSLHPLFLGKARVQWEPGLSALRGLLCYSILISQSADNMFPLCASLLPSAILAVPSAPEVTRTWIFSFTLVFTVGSLHDNMINILGLSWFFSHLPWGGKRKKKKNEKKHNQAF